MSISFKISIRESVIFRVVGKELFLAKIFCDDHLIDTIKLSPDSTEQPIPFISGQLLHLGLILSTIAIKIVIYTHEEDPSILLIPEFSEMTIISKSINALLEQSFVSNHEHKKLIYEYGAARVVKNN